LANLQLPMSTDSTLGGVDPPEDVPSPGAMWGLIASPCTAPESPFMPSSGTPSRASPHTPPAAHGRFCFPVWTTTSTQSSAQRVRSAAHAVTPVDRYSPHVDPVETPGRSRVPVQVEPVGRDESDEGSGAPVDRGRDSGSPAILCHDPTGDFHMWCIGDLPDALLTDDHLTVRLLDTTNLRCIIVGGERTATPGRDGHSVRFLHASGTARLDGLAGRCVVDLGAGVQAHIFPLRGDSICWSADGTPECLEDGIVTGSLQQDAPATSGRDQDPIEATPAIPDRADVVISPTIPMHEVNDDGSKRRRLGRGTFGGRAVASGCRSV
jgi:hypothetical protein